MHSTRSHEQDTHLRNSYMYSTTTTSQIAPVDGPKEKLGRWPTWPIFDEETLEAVKEVLQSGRWTLSGPTVDADLRERVFARKWADFVGTRYCIPTNTGTAALTIALEAMGIGYGDEVLVPALTWVACATAVANVNAIPVLVDINPDTLCMDPRDAEQAITQRTRAIMAVHLYGSMADMDALGSLAQAHDLALLEDAAHVHGAQWNGKRAGSNGLCGAFSMQQTKVLTAGEGGAVTTNDRQLAERLEQLRADSRRYRTPRVNLGEMELEPGGSIHGSNYCLSELHAAVLIVQLDRLPEQNRKRALNAALLDREFAKIPGVTPQAVPEQVTERALYHYAFRFDPAYFSDGTVEQMVSLLSEELGFPVESIYRPLHQSPLWLPGTKRRYSLNAEHRDALAIQKRPLPNCEAAATKWISLHHRFLLADSSEVCALVEAVDRLQRGCA